MQCMHYVATASRLLVPCRSSARFGRLSCTRWLAQYEKGHGNIVEAATHLKLSLEFNAEATK